MTEQETKERPGRPPTAVFATVLCAAVLMALHAVGGFFLLNALLTESEGPWDATVTDTVRLMAVLALVAELVAAAVTAAFIALGRLRRWWYVIPAALILTAVVRMVFAPGP
ncbi:hypothetical protein OG883_33575 [Streptomyces sp. NBC_01142]|uniref:hypothetical protein n=1 Tax=Streptomyces sp. NBC_01142 TaxID=2975865 RepID=UPI002256D2DA|nr:hypothetical protein [Streptomyces sp. NBC_01142]MCX4824702.1 hypothetical protein [Streptomyces sp. NBC_01142]